jgi:ATP-dependent protease ClpP protease subunit
MRKYLRTYIELLDLKIKVEFINTPKYSPNFNLAEYMIHQIRLQILHHQLADMKLDEVEKRLKRKMKEGKLQSKEQIKNTVEHIFNLVN